MSGAPTRSAIALLALLAACAGEASSPWGATAPERLDVRVAVEPGADGAVPESVPLLAELALRIDVFVPGGGAVDVAPTVPDGVHGMPPEVVHERALGTGTWRRLRWRITPTSTGTLELPAFDVHDKVHDQRATAPAVRLEVASVVGTTGDAIEPPAPPFPVRRSPWPWLAAAAALACLLGGALWWRRGRRGRPVEVGIELPPHVRALRALARLRHAPRATATEVDAFYVELSQILRVYLEERFGLHAPERTTEEFLPEVERSGVLAHEQQQHLRQFLQQCDLVKFAAVVPAENVHDASFRFAEDFVDSTRADRAAAPAEPIATGGAA